MTTLLVASAGGHLTQLSLLAPRISPALSDVLWVTYDTAQAHELLRDQEVVFGFPSTRNLPNAARNFRLAGRILRERDVTRVISTGAGISVPFMIQARRRRIPCHYIESATRVQSPSLSGRMLERVPGVVRYTQYLHWIRSGWFYTGSVYDGFRVEQTGEREPEDVLVSLGTHGYRFDRLVRRLEEELPCDAEVVWQLGASADLAPAGDVYERIELAEFENLVRSVDLVVGHAGVGLSLTVLSAGKTPLLTPRRARHGEHVDDHQAVVARELASRGLAVVRDASAITEQDLRVAAGGRVVEDETAPFQLVATETEPAEGAGPVRPLRTPSTWRRRLGRQLALTDAVIIAGSSAGAYVIRQALGEAGILEGFASEVPAALSVLPLWLAIIYSVGGYRPQYLNSAGDAFRRFTAGVTIGVFALGFVSFMFNWRLSRAYVGLLAAMVFVLGGVARLQLRRRLASRHRRGEPRQNVLMVGTDDEALEVVQAIRRSELAGYQVAGFIDDDLDIGSSVSGLQVVGRSDQVLEVAYEHRAGLVIVSPTGVRPGTLRELTITLEGSPVDLAVAPSLFEVVTRRVTVESVANVPILHIDQIRLERGKAALKRTLDLIAAIGLGLLTAPVMAAAAVAIRVTSPGPILFRQRRIGRDGDPFNMVKFRTMVEDAHDRRRDVAHLNEAGHAFFKVREDPRVTPVGRFLRKWSIDELPQVWNVLRGDMSMVGPRPPLPEEVEKYAPWQLRRLRVRPGITGVWQVSGRSEIPFDEAVRMDLFYIENWSLGYDLFLLGKTVLAVLGRTGAY